MTKTIHSPACTAMIRYFRKRRLDVIETVDLCRLYRIKLGDLASRVRS